MADDRRVTDRDLIDEQIAYYRARAPDYDDWFMRTGPYYGGVDPAEKRKWWDEVDDVKAALDAFGPHGDVLEIACGTGWWTEILFPYCQALTAVDASPEVIALNKIRLQSEYINYIQANIFEYEPDRQYDVVFMGFWLSHVPDTRFDAFWDLVRRALKPDGRWFFIDTLKSGNTTESEDFFSDDFNTPMQKRSLQDGREFDIVKVVYEPNELEQRLSSLGWSATVQVTDRFLIYGSGD